MLVKGASDGSTSRYLKLGCLHFLNMMTCVAAALLRSHMHIIMTWSNGNSFRIRVPLCVMRTFGVSMLLVETNCWTNNRLPVIQDAIKVIWHWRNDGWYRHPEAPRDASIPHPPLWMASHDNVIKWKHFTRYWPFVLGIHRSPVNFPHKGPVTRKMFPFDDVIMVLRVFAKEHSWQ